MSDGNKLSRRIVLLLVCIGVAGAGTFWWLCTYSPKIAFLTARGPAEWIVYPKPSDRRVYQTLNMSAEFRRSFHLDQPPQKATLTLRALKRFALSINGVLLEPAPPSGNWKHFATFDVSKQLRSGSNELAVGVFNSNGPPALWLTLDAGSVKLNTDTNWSVSLAGAVWQPARIASQPMELRPGNEIYGGEDAMTSLSHHLPHLFLFAALFGALATLGNMWIDKYQARGEPLGPLHSTRFAVMAMVAAAVVWTALFLNNIRFLPNTVGFDAQTHLDYINFIITHRALPLATDGWEMCQPPLYYLISALIVAPLHSPVAGDAAVRCLRVLGLLAGIAQVWLVFLSLRLIFPKQIGKQLFGLVLVACLPELIYVSQYISNESMGAMWATASLYFCLRFLKEDHASSRLAAATGLCLGAALLTKVTALIAVPFIAGAMFFKLWSKPSTGMRVWLRTLGIVAVTSFAVCGWHYIRVWRHFGTPIVNDWDVASGFAWWTDDGYNTAGQFTRFGECLVHPFYSVFHGFGDGMYSTFWGDGLYGGMPGLRARPPWNYGLMASGFILALAPTAIILIGIGAGIRKFVREPDPVWFLLLGLPVTTLAALGYMYLKLPLYCTVKAFYGMMALIPVCAFGAMGCDVLLKRAQAFRLILPVAIGVWALTAYASFWIQGGKAFTHVTRGVALAGEDTRHDDAIKEFSEALRIDPHKSDAQVSLAVELANRGQTNESMRLFYQALAEHPDDPNGELQYASVRAGQGNLTDAILNGERAMASGPDYAMPYHHVCAWLSQLGRFQEALAVGAQGLRVAPTDPELHFMVANAFATFTNHVEAVRHYQLACELRPSWSAAHDNMGISLAALGRWDEAISQFSQAGRLKPDSATFQDHLALAYATTGRFTEAAAAAARAVELAQKSGDATLAAQCQKRLEYCRAKVAQLQPAAQSDAKNQ